MAASYNAFHCASVRSGCNSKPYHRYHSALLPIADNGVSVQIDGLGWWSAVANGLTILRYTLVAEVLRPIVGKSVATGYFHAIVLHSLLIACAAG